MKLLELLSLKEYSDKVIKQKITDWTAETKGTVPEDVMRAAIDKFDRIKSNIANRIKLKTLVLSPKFMPPDPNKKLKPGEKFQKQVDPQDITKYTWKDIEILFDSYGEKAEKSSKDFNTVQDAHLVDIKGANKVYTGNGLYVYEGSNKESCIRLNYAYKYKGLDNKVYTYNFCVGNKDAGANRYFKYRFGGDMGSGALYRTFYYVADSEQSAELFNDSNERKPQFKNWYHFFVIHVFENGKFGITDAVNEYGTGHELDGYGKGVSWSDIGDFMVKYGKQSGQIAWNKIKNIQNVFKYVSPPEEEEVENAASNGRFNLESFIKASYEVKNAYINKRAGDKNFFTEEMFEICTTEQKNLAINSGFTPTFKNLKNKEGVILQSLARLYAKNKFRRNITAAEAGENDIKLLPLPFIQFLDENQKLKYFELFKKKDITFEYTLKYFGESLAKEYVNEQVQHFKYIPEVALSYISDKKTKILYSIIHKLYKNWLYDPNTNKSEEKLEQIDQMNSSKITPAPLMYDDWRQLDLEERKIISTIIKKYGNKNNPEYEFIKYAMPYLIISRGQELILLPKDKEDDLYNIWVLVDENANIVEWISGSNSNINGTDELQYCFPYDILSTNRVINIEDKNLNLKNIKKPINESKYNLFNYITI